MSFNESTEPVSECASSKRRKLSGGSNLTSDLYNKTDVTKRVFEGLNFFILEAGIGRARTSLFQCKIIDYGGAVSKGFGIKGDVSKPTHLIVDDGMTADRLKRILKVTDVSEFNGVQTLRSAWLSECIKLKRLITAGDYEIKFPSWSAAVSDMSKTISQSDKSDFIVHNVPHNSGVMNKQSKNAPTAVSHKDDSDHDSDYQHSGSEDEHQNIESSCVGTKLIAKGNWVCSYSSANQRINHNRLITDKLEAMAKTYESINDKWRALGYQKAIIAIKKYNKAITSFEEAKSIPGVGVKLAEKIWEIAESGELQKLNELTSQDEMKALELFTNVWGAGTQTARAWIQRGYRSLDDLKADDVGLTRNQRIGLKYYDEFLERMSRSEAGQIEAVVKEMALSINAGLIVMACGSYRRGKQTCGDVDILITHPDGHSHTGVYVELISRLTNTGFLTDNLVSVENNGEQKKYLGVCQLPFPYSKHRRLDLIVVPYSEFACASLYFTGSAHLNRSMRNLASRMNMSLNEHALYSGVVRTKGVKVNQGVPLHTPTEESVFALLGLPYLPPEERDH